jgi:hypothetical protein
MKLVLENGSTYFVQVFHNQNIDFFKAKTVVRIRNEKEEVIATGEAYCATDDNFCKSVGRKIAMERALAQCSFTKSEKKLFWDLILNKRSHNHDKSKYEIKYSKNNLIAIRIAVATFISAVCLMFYFVSK